MRMGAALTELDRALQALVIEWERFFSGDRKLPPVGERDRFARRLRVLVDREARGADAFRREQLQHRFTLYTQMWQRQLRLREEGRVASGYVRADAPRAPNAGPAKTVQSDGDDGLYDQYVAERARLGQKVGVSREAFAEQLDRQREQLEARFGRKVRFRVQVEAGKVKVAARAAKSTDGE